MLNTANAYNAFRGRELIFTNKINITWNLPLQKITHFKKRMNKNKIKTLCILIVM